MTRHLATFNGKSYAFDESLDTLRVQMHFGEDPMSIPSAVRGLCGATLSMHSVASGMQSFLVNTNTQTLANRLEALRQNKDVKFAGSSFVIAGTSDPVLVTNRIFMKFRDDADEQSCLQAISDAGLTVAEAIDYAKHGYYLVATEALGISVFIVARRWLNRADVECCHPEILFRQASRAIHANQWHLKKTVVSYPVEVDASANVEAAHALTRGAATIIAVIDDGFDIDHPAFSAPGKIVAPYDAISKTTDPKPVRDGHEGDNHGTACAGIACAAASSDAIGVAPDAKLMPIRIDGGGDPSIISRAFKWAADHGADVISCSFGPSAPEYDGHDPMRNDSMPLSDDLRLAIKYAANHGRDGKGCVICFAAGNDNHLTDFDEMINCENVLAIAACNDTGRRAHYSQYGKAIFCAFPSGDVPSATPLTRGIWTVDRPAPNGYNPGHPNLGDKTGNYTATFEGTSAACPGAAGVAALVIAANPSLTRIEVRNILKITCDKIDKNRGRYDADGHSIFYGYGRLNAGRAVALAKAWDKSDEDTRRDAHRASVSEATRDAQ